MLTDRRLEIGHGSSSQILGVSYRFGLCDKDLNVGLSRMLTNWGTYEETEEYTIKIMAHEIGHLFGGGHPTPKEGQKGTIMTHERCTNRNFTLPNLKTMRAHLHKIYKTETRPYPQGHCLKYKSGTAPTNTKYKIGTGFNGYFSFRNQC